MYDGGGACMVDFVNAKQCQATEQAELSDEQLDLTGSSTWYMKRSLSNILLRTMSVDNDHLDTSMH